MGALLIVSWLMAQTQAQAQDSIVVRIHPAYGHAGALHRFFLGENYRKEWSMDIRLWVIHISGFNGGLMPEQLGGGMQSKSLRLVDKAGKEWVIRSVEKIPDLVVPLKLRQTFAKDLVDDATSAQNPFAALLVPPVADAVQVAHTHPIICYIAPDPALGQYEKTFAGTVALLEERAPFNKSDNTVETLQHLTEDNRNTYDATAFLKARMIDLLFADWDRHADQWRWHASNNGSGKKYEPIPRDRDQVVSVTEGVLPDIVKGIYTMPRVPGFTGKIRKGSHYLFKSAFLNADPASQFSHAEWTAIVDGFVKAITDPVLEQSIAMLPKPAYDLRHDAFLRILQSRRNGLAAAMEEYYRFINKIVDIQLSDKDEQVAITDTTGGVRVSVFRVDGPSGEKSQLMSKVYDAAFTREIRVYTMAGNDSVSIDHSSSSIKIRVIDSTGRKRIGIAGTGNGTYLYGPADNITLSGNRENIKTHFSNDTTNMSFSPVNLYNLTYPLVNAGLNADDGFLLGAGFRYVRQKGFRKDPYSSMYQLMLTHSFSTRAFRLFYRSEWIRVFGKTDIILQTEINAPNNTINFFGRGNESIYVKAAGVKYYRTRFSTFDLSPALRWRWDKVWSVSAGPSLKYYVYDKDDNTGRFINNESLIGSYDSATLDKSKLHLGGKLNFSYDTRKDLMFPTGGVHASMNIETYKGRGEYARDFAQITPEIAFYQSLNSRKTIVVSDRVGGILSVGQPAFYQSAFLGGQGNLLGYRQYRFAGRHAAFNNFECRVRLAEVSSYILPGELGLSGFFDIGRVWDNQDHSDTWHNGEGAGIYYIPAQLAVFRLIAGHSTEGWYPYISMGIRF